MVFWQDIQEEEELKHLIYEDEEYIANLHTKGIYNKTDAETYIITTEENLNGLINIDDEIKILLDNNDKENIEIIIDDTPYKNRYKKRGFNQAEIICRIRSKNMNLDNQNSSITRSKDTDSQFKLDKKSRYKNIEDAFSINSNIKGKKILIVDDIVTSGSTLREISKVLYKNGALEVRCFTLSKRFKFG